MDRFRYRTPVLAGPWRDRLEDAVTDAMRAGQVDRVRGGDDRLEWRDDAVIERRTDGEETSIRFRPDRERVSSP